MKETIFPKSRLASSLFHYLLVFIAGGCWGSQFLFVRRASIEIAPMMMAFLSLAIGTITISCVLLIIPRSQKVSGKAFLSALPVFLLLGILEGSIPRFCIPWAEKSLATGVTALLMGTTPLFTMMLEPILIRGSHLSWRRISGVLLGFLGIFVLLFPSFAEGISSWRHPQYEGSILLPALVILFAALCCALALLLTKVTLSGGIGPLQATQGIMLGGVLALLPCVAISFLQGNLLRSILHYSWGSWEAVLYIGIFCSGIAYMIFVYLIDQVGPSFASLPDYLIPLVGALLGVFFAGENVTVFLSVALVMILVALWLAGDMPEQKEKKKESQ